MLCAMCGVENPDHASFSRKCGSGLAPAQSWVCRTQSHRSSAIFLLLRVRRKGLRPRGADVRWVFRLVVLESVSSGKADYLLEH